MPSGWAALWAYMSETREWDRVSIRLSACGQGAFLLLKSFHCKSGAGVRSRVRRNEFALSVIPCPAQNDFYPLCAAR